MTLLRRVISAVILLGSVYLLLYRLPSLCSMAVLLVAGSVGLREFYGILKNAGIPAFRILGQIAGASLLLAAYVSLNIAILLPHPAGEPWREFPGLVMALIVFAVCVRQFPQKNNPQPLPTIACTLLGVLYVPFLLLFIVGLAFRWTPTSGLAPLSATASSLLVYLIVVVKASDVGAYFVGSMVGRHKMFPRISPGKTWEGLAGGFAAGLLASLVCFWWLRDGAASATVSFGNVSLSFFHAWILGALLAAVGVIGDLVESLLKRSAGLKDSGCLFPGMGGILDVLDSLLFAGPTLYFYVRWCATNL